MKQVTFHKIMITIGIIIVVMLILSLATMLSNRRKDHQPPQDGTDSKICMTLAQFEAMKQETKQTASCKQEIVVKEKNTVDFKSMDVDVEMRDKQVIMDPLYPPLNRTDAQTHRGLKQMLAPGDVPRDTFRLLGYLKSTNTVDKKDAGGDTWKLFGRMKDRHMGEFYITPANTQDDIKIPLSSEIIKGERLRDVYTIPSQITFNSPLLHTTPYMFVELPKADLPSHYM